MKRKNILPSEAPEGFILGSRIDISCLYGHEIFVDISGNLHCIFGYRRENQPLDLPFYHPSVAARDNNGRTSYRFVELRRGALAKSGFLRDDQYYRQINDRRLMLPSGANNYFGVITEKDRQEDAEMTRQLFGGVSKEIAKVAGALSHLIGRSHHEMVRLPRITFSKIRQNQCDISGCLIPRDFPYLAFEESQFAWSHISLHGFYRLLSFLCSANSSNPIRQAMLDSGISERLLDAFIGNDDGVGVPIPYPEYY